MTATPSVDRAEVLVGGGGLQRGPVDVLGTLLHEAAHGLAHVRTLGDTSRQGRDHNHRYATIGEELGLDVAHLDPIGWSATSVPEQTSPAGPVSQCPGLFLFLCLWPTDPGGALGAGAVSRRCLATTRSAPGCCSRTPAGPSVTSAIPPKRGWPRCPATPSSNTVRPLAAYGVPETIQHDDLHHASLYLGGDRLRVLD